MRERQERKTTREKDRETERETDSDWLIDWLIDWSSDTLYKYTMISTLFFFFTNLSPMRKKEREGERQGDRDGGGGGAGTWNPGSGSPLTPGGPREDVPAREITPPQGRLGPQTTDRHRQTQWPGRGHGQEDDKRQVWVWEAEGSSLGGFSFVSDLLAPARWGVGRGEGVVCCRRIK